jgi:hypothetical protein
MDAVFKFRMMTHKSRSRPLNRCFGRRRDSDSLEVHRLTISVNASFFSRFSRYKRKTARPTMQLLIQICFGRYPLLSAVIPETCSCNHWFCPLHSTGHPGNAPNWGRESGTPSWPISWIGYIMTGRSDAPHTRDSHWLELCCFCWYWHVLLPSPPIHDGRSGEI